MCATLVGGMDRLKRNYIDTAKQHGVKLKVFTGKENKVSDKIGKSDFVIIFTNQISHRAKKDIASYTKANGIPLHMHHACGISTLRDCLKGI